MLFCPFICRLPEEISVADLHKALMSHDSFDFLTNAGMGVAYDDMHQGGKGTAPTAPEF